jgi:hypothetical protein
MDWQANWKSAHNAAMYSVCPLQSLNRNQVFQRLSLLEQMVLWVRGRPTRLEASRAEKAAIPKIQFSLMYSREIT